MDEANAPSPADLPAISFAAALPPGYQAASATELTFDPRLAFELAVGVSDAETTFRKYGHDRESAIAVMQNPAFIQKIKEYKDEVTKSGYGFRLRAKIQAEDLLTVSYALIQDVLTPAAVRADLIKWTAKMADLEPKSDSKGGAAGGGGAVQLSISFYGQPTAVQVDSRPALEAERVDA